MNVLGEATGLTLVKYTVFLKFLQSVLMVLRNIQSRKQDSFNNTPHHYINWIL